MSTSAPTGDPICIHSNYAINCGMCYNRINHLGSFQIGPEAVDMSDTKEIKDLLQKILNKLEEKDG